MEYKFRAWDKKDKIIREVTGINFTNKDLWLRYNDKQIVGANFFEVELMPSTGVKDINKKESYLGDIVKYGDSTGVITYKDGCYEIDWVINKDFFTERLGVFKEAFEIIGNKFKNIDMLKKEV